MDVVRIGRCAGCGKSARLESELCAACLPRYGPELGHLFRMVRETPGFGRRCFDGLMTDSQRELFIQMFGDPRKRSG
jgi:hypothetical protein